MLKDLTYAQFYFIPWIGKSEDKDVNLTPNMILNMIEYFKNKTIFLLRY